MTRKVKAQCFLAVIVCGDFQKKINIVRGLLRGCFIKNRGTSIGTTNGLNSREQEEPVHMHWGID